MKKTLLLNAILACFVFFGTTPALEAAFPDVADDHPYSESISYVEETGIVEGYPDGTFKPDKTINRAEFTKILMGAAFIASDIEECLDRQSEELFSDTEDEAWYAPFVCIAKDTGAVGGYPDGTFKPAAEINFVEAAKIIVNSFDFTLRFKSDVWYEAFVFELTERAAVPTSIQGFEHNITRGEMAEIIYRLNEEVEDKESQLTEDLIGEVEFYYEFGMTAEDCYEGENFDAEAQLCLPEGCEKYEDCSEEFMMLPEDCVEGEQYDTDDKICYYECDTEEDCAAKEAAINEQLEALGEDFFDGEKEIQELPEGEELPALITYKVENGNIVDPTWPDVSEELTDIQDNRAQHDEIWKYFTRIFPAKNITDFVEFQIFTDGVDGVFAHVAPTEDDPTKWLMGVDPKDFYPDGKTIDDKEAKYTLIHEFAHVFTLGAKQVAPGGDEASCTSFFLQEGCSNEDSYVNAFFQKFWKDIYEEHQDMNTIEGQEEYEMALEQFHYKFTDRFITAYAATNPGEDIAESFTAFILKEKPTGDSIADQKIQFFYDYPELVKLRKVVRSRLAQ